MDNYARITITLSRTEYLSLVDSARQEIRPPRDHARYLLRRILFGEQSANNNTVAPISDQIERDRVA